MCVSWAVRVHCDGISGCDSVSRPPAASVVVANYRKCIVLTLMTKDGWRAESAKPPKLHEAEKTPSLKKLWLETIWIRGAHGAHVKGTWGDCEETVVRYQKSTSYRYKHTDATRSWFSQTRTHSSLVCHVGLYQKYTLG